MYIGKKLKEIRKSKGVKLIELAERSGVQIATLSRIENQKMTGSLESHMKIAQALSIDITQLYSEIVSTENNVDIKNPQSQSDVFVHTDKSAYEILVSKVLSKRMMPTLLKIEPGGKTNPEQNPAGSEKFLYVIEGKVEIFIGDQSYNLARNSSLYFDASMSHYFTNNGKTTVKILSVTTPVAL